MSKIVGFVGKGGTGKTTLTALFLKYMLKNSSKPVLVIDADPNSCLGDLLALNIESTVGNVRHELMQKKKDLSSTSISKVDYCEYAINSTIIESTGFDIITMGKPDGPGCYCYVNNIVKMMIEKMQKHYEFIIVDCEAGLEHFSRKTIGNMNIAFIISDLSKKGILTGVRQGAIMNELDIKTEKNFIIINDIEGEKVDPYIDYIHKTCGDTLNFAGTVRHDRNIEEYEFISKSLLDLPENSASCQDMKEIVEKIKIQGLNIPKTKESLL
ncbi:MAG: AAA family ATPase [bacterium]